MKRYDTYKDSGIEWIGELPGDWNIKSLKYLADVMPSNVDKKTADGEQAVKLCNYVDVYKNNYITGKLDFMEATASDAQIEKLSIRQGDVIATKDSEDPNDIAVPSLVKEEFENVVCGYHLTLMRAFGKELLGDFLFWAFSSNKYRQYFSTQAKGVTRYAVGISAFKNLPIPLPTLEEQNQIARYLDHKTGQIDKLIVDKQKLIELLNEERTAMINQAVTKGLNTDVPMKDSGVEWLGEIPAHWEVMKFNLAIAIRHGHQFMNYDFTESGIKIVKITQLSKDGYLDLSKCSFISNDRINEFQDILIKEHDILMCLTGGTIGKIIRVGSVSEPLFQNYRVGHFSAKNKDAIVDDFIFWLMSSDYLIAQIFFQMRETGQPNIGMDDFGRMKISIPPITEQVKIVEIIVNEDEKIKSLKQNINKEIDLLKEYKTALISEVVTGKVDVREEIITNAQLA